jgi:NTP pyrophosphatase (non-canonical NTP hydrolase)
LTCTISGSFRRFLKEIAVKAEECRRNGVTVASPKSTVLAREVNGFVLLERESGTPADLERGHLDAIERSDFLYLVNPGGYVGPSATLEVGYAAARSVPVYCSDPPQEPVVSYFSTLEPEISMIARQLRNPNPLVPPVKGNLLQLQAYIKRIVAARGFDDESIRDVVLLLVEEVGELAKAVRRAMGLKTSPSSSREQKTVSHELADCLIYLLDIANLADIDLEQAFQEKEKLNSVKYPNQ